jgi:hypothetical protein
MPEQNSILSRLEDQITWYDRRSLYNHRFFKWLKVCEIIAAAIIPFAAGTGASPLVTGGLGVLIVILEALQHLNQYQHNWIVYRSTCEELKHEKYLYLGAAGPYATTPNALVLLAERIESLISQEHAKWVAVQEQAAKVKRQPAP